jgi:hypothetical protein
MCRDWIYPSAIYGPRPHPSIADPVRLALPSSPPLPLLYRLWQRCRECDLTLLVPIPQDRLEALLFCLQVVKERMHHDDNKTSR